MSRVKELGFSKREKQIMDYIYQTGTATAKEVMDNILDPPSYSAIRALLKILVDKGHLKYKQEGLKYVFFASTSVKAAKKTALKEVLNTYFNNSIHEALVALIDTNKKSLTSEDLDEIEELVKTMKKDIGNP